MGDFDYKKDRERRLKEKCEKGNKEACDKLKADEKCKRRK